MPTDKAVILAAGRGTRMRQKHVGAMLSDHQAHVALTGLKALMPVGRPFIDYVFDGLRKAGYSRICLVVSPESRPLRQHCCKFSRNGFSIEFAIQERPLGTANALTAARRFAGEDSFLVINADNYYPIEVLAKMQEGSGSAVAAFRPEGLCRGNIRTERLRDYALIRKDAAGLLSQIVEKPGEVQQATLDAALINMNCWRFGPKIFTACDAIPLSERNEFELPDAVMHVITVLNEPFTVVEVNEPVLDLSTRADVAEVSQRLAGIRVQL